MAYVISEHMRNRINAAGTRSLAASSIPSEATATTTKKKKKNKHGALGGIGYTLGQLGTGIFGVHEGVYDFLVGGVADIIGQDEYAKRLHKDDITGRWQQGLNDWYNPSKAMNFVGDVAGGLGQTGVYVGLSFIPYVGGAVSAAVMATSAAGRGTTAAYQKTGKLGGKEYLYGIGSGVTELALEKATGGVGKIAGAIKGTAKGAAKGASKSVAKSAVRSGVLRTMWDAGKGEFVEESLSEMIDPYLQRATIDPNAKNASAQEILRAGMVGFVSGAVGGAGGSAIGNTASLSRGKRITNTGNTDFTVYDRRLGERTASSGSTEMVLQRAETLLSKIDTAQNAETVAGNLLALKGTYDAYNKLSNKGGIRGQMLLGEMARNIAYTELSGGVEASKADIKQHADVLAQYLTEQKGQTYTAEDIKNNKDGILTDLAIADFSAKMIIDPDTALTMVKRGESGVLDMASQYEAWKGNLTAEQLQEANTALGLDLSNATFQDFNKAMAEYNKNNQTPVQQQPSIDARKAQAQPLPDTIALQEGETAIYKTESGEYVAVKRDGEGYLVAADDANGNGLGKTSKHLTEEQVNDLIKGVKNKNVASKATKPNSAEERFSIQFTKNGDQIVVIDTDQNIFNGKNETDYPKIVRRYMFDKFRGKVLPVDKNKAYINREQIEEYTYPAKRRESKEVRIAKLKAGTELDNLLKTAQYVQHVDDDGRHPEAVRGWDKYSVRFIVDNRMFEGEVSIELVERGDLFYDITKIKDITPGTSGSMPTSRQSNVFGNVNISQKSDNVNTLEQKSSEKVETSKVKEIKARFETAALTEEGRAMVKDFDNLPASTQARIREMISTGKQFNTVSQADMEFVANLMAKRSGVSVAFTDFGKGGLNGLFTTTKDNKRFIQLNANNASNAIKIAAVHELAHELRKSKPVGYEKFAKGALKILSKEELEEIKKAYTDYYQKKGVDTESEKFADLLDDEYQAHAMQKLFSGKQFLERYINYENKGILEQAKGVATKLANKFKGVFSPAYRQYEKYIKTYEAILAMPSLAEVNAIEENKSAERYSISIDGKDTMVDVEEGKNLVALHNLSESNLLRVIELGGFPMPSVAVTTTELPHENYGDITVVFGRDTIDPELDNRNVVYDRDAWTPTTPTVDVKLNNTKVSSIVKEMQSNVDNNSAFKREIYNFFDSKYRDNNGDYIIPETEYSKELVGDRAIKNSGIVAAYLGEKGIKIAPVYTERGFTMGWTSFTRKEAENLLSYVGITKDITRDNATQEQREDILEKFIEYRAKEKLGLMRRFKKNPNLTVEEVKESLRKDYDDGNVSQLFFMSEEVFDENRSKDVYDEYATVEKMQNAVTDKQDFYNWFWKKIEGAFEKKGIDNDSDIFDSRGNRRSFEQRHFSYTAANIVKAMAKGEQEGKAAWGISAGALAAKLSQQFESIEDIRAAKKYLALVSEEDLKAFNDQTYELYDELVTDIAGQSADFLRDSSRRDDVGDILGKCAAAKPLTVANIKRVFDRETKGYNLGYKFDEETARQALTLFQTLQHVPTTYFEAKPRRVVEFNEIKTVLVPETASQKLKDRLDKHNIKWQTYEGENNRSKIIKKLDDIRFSIPLKDSNGNTLSKEQQEFFKDSKVRDEEGNLLVVYNGVKTERNTEALDYGYTYHFLEENLQNKDKPNRFGFFFTDSKETAEEYSTTWFSKTQTAGLGRVNKVYLNIKKPLDLRSLGLSCSEKEFYTFIEQNGVITYRSRYKSDYKPIWSRFDSGSENLRRQIEAAGYDGIIYHDWGEETATYVAFSSNQIKNTTNQNPTENPDIRFSIKIGGENVGGLIDEYSEKEYNDFGWARVNGILSFRENGNFKSEYGKIKIGTQKNVHKTANGEIIVPVNDMEKGKYGIDNVLVFAKGTHNYYKITRVIRILLDNETAIEIVRGDIYEIERKQSTFKEGLFWENVYGEELVREYSPETFGSYQEVKAQWGGQRGRTDGRTSDVGNQGEQDGGGDSGSNQETVRHSIPTKIDTLSAAELEKLSDEEFNELYDFFGIDDILAAAKDTDTISGFDSTWDDISVADVSKETKVEPKKVEIFFKRKGLGDSHIERDKMAVMTNDRINKEIKDSGAMNKTYARSYITRISPTDFIDLTVASNHLNRDVFDSSVEGDSGSKMTTYNYVEGLKSTQTPYLHINKATGQIIGHNGRHRMRALEMAGIESAEITIFLYDENGDIIKYNAETIPNLAISSQFDTAIETHLYNVIPLNESHRDEIFSNYGEREQDTAIRYSISYAPTGKTAIAMTTKEDKRAFRDRVREANQKTRIAFIDAQAAIADEFKRLGVDSGEALIQAARSATSKAQHAIGGNIVDITEFSKNGKEPTVLSKGVAKLMQPIEKAGLEAEFFDYLFNLHNIDRLKVNKPVNGNTAEESQQAIKEAEKAHPEFVEWQKEWAQMVDALMTLRLKAGLITQELYDELKARYPHYVPTFREEGKSSGTAGDILGKYDLSVKRTIKNAKGSTDTLLRPDEMIARQTLELYRAIEQNNLLNALYDAGASKGSTSLEIVSREKMRTSLEKTTTDNIADLETINEDKPNSATNTVTFFKDGEKITLRVSKNIFTGLEALHPGAMAMDEGWLLNGMRKVMNAFKSGVTNLNPFFLARNAARDIQDAIIYTKNDAGFLKAYPRAYAEMAKNGNLWQLYVAAGGMSSSVFDSHKGFVGSLSDRGFAEAEGFGKRVLQRIDTANLVVEQLPRFAEFIASIEAGKSIDQAILDSADVTVNFGRSGKITKWLNSYLIPFLNASVQGASKTFRTFTGIKTIKEFCWLVGRCAILGIAPAILSSIMYDDDEDYQNLRTEDKQNYYLFKVGDKFIKIPRGRLAALLSGVVVRTDLARKGEDDAFKGLGKSALETLTPVESASRSIFSPFADVKNNVTWYGTAIEGREFDNKAVKDRYDEGTSSIAIALGKLKLMQEAGMSPKKIHYLIDQYAGVIGDIFLPMTTKKAERTPLASNFTVDPITNNKLSTKFYKLYDETTYASSAGDSTAALKLRHFNKVKQGISDLYKQKDEIQASKLSDKEKLARTRIIQTLINEAYKTAIDESELWTKAFADSEGLGTNYSVVEVTKSNYKKLEESKETIGSFVIAYNGKTTGKAYETEEKATKGLSSMISDFRFAEGYRLMGGTEQALAAYNTAAYEKAQKLNAAGIDYDSYYTAYMTLKQYSGDASEKREYALSTIEALDLTRQQRLMLIYAFGYSVNGELWGLSSKAAKRVIANYIKGLRIKSEEKIALAKACGLTVKNGKIVVNS